MIIKSGFINVIKPTGMTSSDVVFAVKKKLKIKKIGHLGTLDPAATGVLPIAVGKATKFFDYFLNKDKVYMARVKFGIETDTLDSFGKVVKKDNKTVLKDEILAKMSSFVGKIEQYPPKYSAIKINGKRACDLARDNIDFEIKPKQIEVFSIEIINDFGDNEFLFKVHCSAGTYIRTLFSDLAYSIGTVSTTTAILRTRSGRFDISEAFPLDEIDESSLISIREAFKCCKVIEANEVLAKKFINGVLVSADEIKDLNEDEFFVSFKKVVIGFYKKENNLIKPIVYLYEVNND